MKSKGKYFLFIFIVPLCYCSPINTKNIITNLPITKVVKLEMFLNAFGVEADGFPTINATIDFVSNTNTCSVSYYEPWIKPKQYNFSKLQLDTLKILAKSVLLKNIEYNERSTDQPTSTTTIYTTQDTFKIKDYGLIAEFPLPELYRIVYDLKKNFR